MIPGTAHANEESMEMKQRPSSPKRLMTRSTTNAARAM
jgi:hypothetical protein